MLFGSAAGLGVFAVDVEGSVGAFVVMVNAWWEVRHFGVFCKLPFKWEACSKNKLLLKRSTSTLLLRKHVTFLFLCEEWRITPQLGVHPFSEIIHNERSSGYSSNKFFVFHFHV